MDSFTTTGQAETLICEAARQDTSAPAATTYDDDWEGWPSPRFRAGQQGGD